MKRTSLIFEVKDIAAFRKKALLFSQQFREVVHLNSNDHHQKYSSIDELLAFDAFTSLQTDAQNSFAELEAYQHNSKDWLFGFFTYDVKNAVEPKLTSTRYDGLEFPDLYFFQPKKILFFKDNQIEFSYLPLCEDEIESDFEEINDTVLYEHTKPLSLDIEARITKADYIAKVNKMKEFIYKGDIYEANFCMEFFAEEAFIDPLDVYQKLNAISRPPFAAFFKMNKHFVMSASPERYLKKKGNTVVSQPIKGTAKRGKDVEEDTILKSQLEFSEKERSENIMIVDLVRNDLSKTASRGTVKVEELCGIYTFDQVHQMISTVVSEVDPTVNAVEVIKTTFPMGSMTGAPKFSAMQIIESLEETKRGLYSGAIGYFSPDSDFDFNVIIRSILYNQATRYVSFSVGSAITAKADPVAEYQECLLKAKAMQQVLR